MFRKQMFSDIFVFYKHLQKTITQKRDIIVNYQPKYIKIRSITTYDKLIEANPKLKNNHIIKKVLENSKFPFLTNDYYAQLIGENENDPVKQIVVPTEKEYEQYQKFEADKAKGSLDTSGESTNYKGPAIQHKYGPTALAITSNVCGSLCRECFRKRIFLDKEDAIASCNIFPNTEAIKYLKSCNANTILLSGGDAFMLTDESIKEMLNILDDPELEHINTIRFGTKMQAFYPERITDELLKILTDFQDKTGKSIEISTHFEHKQELTPDCIKALRKTRDAGLIQYNQTVFLVGINDNASVLYDLFEEMSKHGVRPYYLFQCRPVIASLHQQLELKRGIKIYKELMQKMSGTHKPRYVMSTPIGKIEIIDVNPRNEDEVILRLHSSKNSEKTGDIIFYNVKENDPHWYLPKGN